MKGMKIIKDKVIIFLRNEFDFWKVHGIMNTRVSCKVNVKAEGFHVNFVRDPRYL